VTKEAVCWCFSNSRTSRDRPPFNKPSPKEAGGKRRDPATGPKDLFDAKGEALEHVLTTSFRLRNDAIKNLSRYAAAVVNKLPVIVRPSFGWCGTGNFRHGQRTLQLGSPSGGVNFFNAICRLLMYEGSFSTRFSDLLFSTDSFVCAESVSAGVGLGSSLSVSIDPLQLINATVLSTAIILNSRQVVCTRSENALK
jgi:hypothetical protein